MINPVLSGGDQPKKKAAPAKKGKAKTQAGAKKKKNVSDDGDSLDGFIVDDDEDVQPARKKAKTAKGKKK